MADLYDLGRFDDPQVLQLWSAVMVELRRRGLIKTNNGPTGDYCELLVARQFGVEPATNSQAGYDLITPGGDRIQVKGRRFTQLSRPTRFSVIRNLEDRGFDRLIALTLNDDFTVRDAWSLTWDAVKRHAKYRKHVNGWVLPIIRGRILDDPEVTPFVFDA